MSYFCRDPSPTSTPISKGSTLADHVAMLQEQRRNADPTQAPRLAKIDTSIPKWLIPDTYEWNKQVERNGKAEMWQRRKIALQQQQERLQTT